MTHSFPTRRSSDLKCLNTSWLRLTARYFRYTTNQSELLHAPNLASYSTAFLRLHGSACPALVNRDDACPSQSKVVLKSDPGAFHLSRTGSPAQLRHKLRALRQAGRSQRMPFGEQSTRRVSDDLAPIGVVAVHDETLGFANCTKPQRFIRSEEHTSELQSLMRISYAVFCLKKKTTQKAEK